MAHWHVANRERVMSDHVHWAGDAPDIALGPGDAIEVEQFYQPDLDSEAPRPSDPFRCTDVVVQVHTVAQRPAHVRQPRLVLAIAGAKAARLPAPHADRARVTATLSIHNNGPSDAVLSLGWMCAARDPSRLGLFAIDAAGNETRLRPEVDVMLCVQSSAPPRGHAVRRGETFSTTVTRATDTQLKPGRYRLVLRYRGNGDPIMEGDEAVGRMWSGEAESKPVELVVP
jgi:hypothetical protein